MCAPSPHAPTIAVAPMRTPMIGRSASRTRGSAPSGSRTISTSFLSFSAEPPGSTASTAASTLATIQNRKGHRSGWVRASSTNFARPSGSRISSPLATPRLTCAPAMLIGVKKANSPTTTGIATRADVARPIDSSDGRAAPARGSGVRRRFVGARPGSYGPRDAVKAARGFPSRVGFAIFPGVSSDCRSGEIGRHARFRAVWGQPHVGSNPTFGTTLFSARQTRMTRVPAMRSCQQRFSPSQSIAR